MFLRNGEIIKLIRRSNQDRISYRVGKDASSIVCLCIRGDHG